MKGIPSDFIEVKDIGRYDMAGYRTLFIYRCSYSDKLKNKIDEAKGKGKRVVYDIDDYIFDFDGIKDLDFLKKDEYKDFELYSSRLRECMGLCDGFVTSTVSLKEMIEKSFPDKPVCVNRNVASMEMVILSLEAIENVNKADSKVVLGYFSGTKTHDKDFLLIKDVLLELLAEHDNLYLKLGGVVETENEFSRFEDRIERSGFIDWRLLPEILKTNVLPYLIPLAAMAALSIVVPAVKLLYGASIAAYTEKLLAELKDAIATFYVIDRPPDQLNE
jgi:hypothetical protein